MATKISGRYNFAIVSAWLVGMLFALLLSSVSDAAPPKGHVYVFMTSYFDMVVPTQSATKLDAAYTSKTDPADLSAGLTAALATADKAFNDDYFKSAEFKDVINAFQDLLDKAYVLYGDQFGYIIYEEAPILRPSILAGVAHACGIKIANIVVRNSSLVFSCPTNSYKNGEVQVRSTLLDVSDDANRTKILQAVCFPKASDYTSSPLSKLDDASWNKMVAKKDVKVFWRRILLTYDFDTLRQNSKGLHLFSASTKDSELLTFGGANGYSTAGKLDKSVTTTEEIPLLPLVVKKGDDYFMAKDNDIPAFEHSATIVIDSSINGEGPLTKHLAELMSKATAAFFSSSNPPTHVTIDKDWSSSSNSAAFTGRSFGMSIISFGVLSFIASHCLA